MKIDHDRLKEDIRRGFKPGPAILEQLCDDAKEVEILREKQELAKSRIRRTLRLLEDTKWREA